MLNTSLSFWQGSILPRIPHLHLNCLAQPLAFQSWLNISHRSVTSVMLPQETYSTRYLT